MSCYLHFLVGFELWWLFADVLEFSKNGWNQWRPKRLSCFSFFFLFCSTEKVWAFDINFLTAIELWIDWRDVSEAHNIGEISNWNIHIWFMGRSSDGPVTQSSRIMISVGPLAQSFFYILKKELARWAWRQLRLKYDHKQKDCYRLTLVNT